MSWLEVAFVTFLTATILATWARHSLEKRLWLRVAELYLWLVPAVSIAWLAALHDARGLRVTAVVGFVHLLVIAVSVWSLAAARVDVARRAACWASCLLIVGSGVVWLGAVTFPGMDLTGIFANRADHLFTTGLFFLGMVITLAGFTLLTGVLRQAGAPALADLGLVAFLFGSTFWVIHLAFRAVVMVAAAEEMSVAGAAPPWYASWRPWAGLMYGIYMTMAYLSTAAYGAAMLTTGWAGRGWGRTFVAAGLLAAIGFVALRAFDLPLLVQFMPYVMGILLLRRVGHQQLFVRETAVSANADARAG